MNKEINAMEDKYKLYDELLATLYVNIQVEYGRDEGIYIRPSRQCNNVKCNGREKPLWKVFALRF